MSRITPSPPGSSLSPRLSMDPDELRRAAARFDDGATTYDAVGADTPPPGTGAAAPLIALALGSHLEASTLIVSEARVIAVATQIAASHAEVADAQTALAFFDLSGA